MTRSSANSLDLSALAVLAAYLVGSIPFGYLVARWVKGIDIRTVGSGNLGATNVGRILGFRYFLLVLALDPLKGFLPTLGFPWLLSGCGGPRLADLPVLIALAAILGHTFPVYLKFRGGKGIATSLGAVLVLDPVSCAVAVLVFGGVLLVTRYVSLSALVACLAFAAAHFARDFRSVESRAYRHEPIHGRRRGLAASSGIAPTWLGSGRVPKTGSTSAVDARSPTARLTPAAGQPDPACRSGSVVGCRSGRALAVSPCEPDDRGECGSVGASRDRPRVFRPAAGRPDHVRRRRDSTGRTCPRYDRVVIYQVDAPDRLKEIKVIDLEGTSRGHHRER